MSTTSPFADRATVLLTGGTSGIGRALLERLLARGHRVVVLARSAAHLPPQPGLVPVAADLTDSVALPGLILGLMAGHPDLRVVINNAAVQHARPLTDPGSSPAHLIEEVALNLLGPALIVQAALPDLIARQPSAVVNISSGLAFFPKAASGLYPATKAGLHSWSQSLRDQVAARGVSVTEAILPIVDTPMTAGRGGAKMSPGVVADLVLTGAARGRAEVLVGKARLLPLFVRLAPGLGRAILRGS